MGDMVGQVACLAGIGYDGAGGMQNVGRRGYPVKDVADVGIEVGAVQFLGASGAGTEAPRPVQPGFARPRHV